MSGLGSAARYRPPAVLSATAVAAAAGAGRRGLAAFPACQCDDQTRIAGYVPLSSDTGSNPAPPPAPGGRRTGSAD